MTHFKIAAKAGGLFGASLLAIGLATASVQTVNSAPLQVLPAKLITPESAIVEAKYRPNRKASASSVRSRRAYRGRPVYSRRGGNPAAAAAIIGAFGAVAAAAIAAESRRDRVVYHTPHAPAYGGYDYYPNYTTGYSYPSYGYVAPAPVYSNGYYYKQRSGIGRVFGGNRYPRAYSAPVYRSAVPAYRGAVPVYGGNRGYGGQRVHRGGAVNGGRRALRRIF